MKTPAWQPEFQELAVQSATKGGEPTQAGRQFEHENEQ